MIGVTEQKAKEIFGELFGADLDLDWDFEGLHFADICNRHGLDAVKDAEYAVKKAQNDGKSIGNGLNYFYGCLRRVVDNEAQKKSANSNHPRGDDGGVTPAGFNSYNDYFEYLKRKVQEDFPDTPEQAAQRNADYENRRDRLRVLHEEKIQERKEAKNELL